MMASAVVCVIGVLSAALFAPVRAVNLSDLGFTNDPAALPHSSCRGTTLVDCPAGNYSIPGNFDLNLIPKTATAIFIGSDAPADGMTSYIHGDADPLPSSLTYLYTVHLYSVEGTNSTRVPLESFLRNVKGQLTILRLQYCRINPLRADFLHGFRILRNLYLEDSDIRDIDVNAFDTRVTLPANTRPALRFLKLNRNIITSLDWAVFAPVADSLEILDLVGHSSEGSLTNLTLSKSFTFANLTSLNLQKNRLNFLPRYILDTLTISDKAVIRLDDNAFCPSPVHSDCTCCEAEDFVKWTHEIARGSIYKRPTLTFTCGNAQLSASKNWSMSSINTNLPPLDQYSCCTDSSGPGCVDQEPNSSGVTRGNVILITIPVLLIVPLRRYCIFPLG